MSDRLPELLAAVARAAGRLIEPDAPFSTPPREAEIRRRVEALADFREPVPAGTLIEGVADLLARWGPRPNHSRYLGLFNPSVLPIAAAGGALAAAANPQLALWAHAPAAQEIERRVLAYLADRAGLPPGGEAHFTSGGQEANRTALLAALAGRFPDFATAGARGLSGPPAVYLSREGHESFEKVVVAAGLGREALRRVPVDRRFRMDPVALAEAIAADRAAGAVPVLAVATAGTTATGAIDPIREIAAACRAEDVPLHVDAAWGGMALLDDRHRRLLDGIGDADSVTVDAHKGLDVPIPAGIFLSREPGALAPLFAGSGPAYAPEGVRGGKDPYTRTLAWSRPLHGLPLFLALAAEGAAGTARRVAEKFRMGELLREKLPLAGFRVVNDSPLPLVCFTHPRIEKGALTARSVVRRILGTGQAWISEVDVAGERALRACVTSHRTTEEDLDVLVDSAASAVRPAKRRGR